jgi:uncharacterized membrane protein (UPF0127 family)
MYAIRILSALALACLLTACVPEASPTVTLDGVTVNVVVTDSQQEWSQGLQGYDPLADGEGMLFDFGSAAPRTFAMKDVTFPIDVVFIAEDGVVSAIEPLAPGDTRLVTSPSPSAYVIELPQGWAEENGIGIGDPFEYAE